MTARRFRRCRGALRRPIARPLRQADHDPRRPANRVTLSVVALTLMLAAPVAAPLAAQQDTTIHVLTLGGAARLASRQSATVLAARAEADQASARVHESFSSFLPNVYGGASEREFTENSGVAPAIPPQPGISRVQQLAPSGRHRISADQVCRFSRLRVRHTV